MKRKNEWADDSNPFGSVVVWIAVFLLIVGIIWIVWAVLLQPSMNVQRNAEQHSNAYVQGKVGQLGSLMADYNLLETKVKENASNQTLVDQYVSQQKADVMMMWQTFDSIPPDIQHSVVPSDVQAFLNAHPRGS